jgi:glucose-1-phosphate adenylyltransferase
MDYHPLLRYHHERQADVTVCVTEVPSNTASRSGIVVANDGGRVNLFLEKPSRPFNTLASMGVYVFRTEVLVRRLTQDASLPNSTHDFGRDVLPRMLELGDRFYAYRFGDYWVDAGTVQAYWEANMDLLGPDPPLNLFDPRWRIYTRSEERPPAYISPGAAVSNSFITDGCIIEGQVERSVLSPGVRVRVGAVVRNSVIFGDCDIGSGAVVDRAILDKNVTVGEEAVIGCDLDGVPTHGSYHGENNRLTLVGKNTHLPTGLRVCRGCVVDSDLTEDDFAADLISSNRHAKLQPRDDPRSLSSIHPLIQEGVPAIPVAIRPTGEG